jgi:hypothetical protein
MLANITYLIQSQAIKDEIPQKFQNIKFHQIPRVIPIPQVQPE